MWLVENIATGEPLGKSHPDRESAQKFHAKLGEHVSKHYRVVIRSGDQQTDRMINEGMEPGDLYRILLPVISIDEYVSGTEENDDIVLGFFIRGVETAIMPFEEFCRYSRGVSGTDHGTTSLYRDCSVVYVEFKRHASAITYILELIHHVCRMASIKPSDLTLTFPISEDKFPFSEEIIREYFRRRDEMASRAAAEAAREEIKDETEEDIVERIASINMKEII